MPQVGAASLQPGARLKPASSRNDTSRNLARSMLRITSVKLEDELGSELAAFLANTPKSRGLPVLACLPGSSAAAGGIRKGDLVVEVNGVTIDGPESYVLARKLDSDAMHVKLIRDERVLTFTLRLESSTIPPVNARGTLVS